MYNTGEDLLKLTQERKARISEIVIDKEQKLLEISKDSIIDKMNNNLNVMIKSSQFSIKNDTKSVGGIIGGEAKKITTYYKNNTTICGNLINKAMARALSCSEVNASMGKICAAPTAGSCGIIPASILTVGESLNLSKKDIIYALFTASGIGEIILKNATLSGAEGGCQAECGAAASMAAAAIVEMAGGTPVMSFNAAAIALKNVMGLICDPIAGLVESPCAKRNASGTVNAMISADLALAGVKSVIPFDEVVETMYKVGELMPSQLKETAKGGLATSKTGIAIKNKLFNK